MGLCVERIELAYGSRTVLPRWVSFADDPDRPTVNPDGTSKRVHKTTHEWPVHKFIWREFTARAGGGYQYKITGGRIVHLPKRGELRLRPREHQRATKSVDPSPVCTFTTPVSQAENTTICVPRRSSCAASAAVRMLSVANS